MSDLHDLAAGFRNLYAEVDAFAADHSPAAIFRRARRASMSNLPKARRWKARAIDLDPEPLHNAIALSGMVPIMIDERWHLGVAVAQPSPIDGAINRIDDIVLIDPVGNTAQVMGDRGRTFVGPINEVDRLTVTRDPKTWARAIAMDRLEWFRLRRQRIHLLQAEPTWTGDIPAALLLASPKRVRWSDLRANVLDVPADLRRDVQRAVYAQARLPQIEGWA